MRAQATASPGAIGAITNKEISARVEGTGERRDAVADGTSSDSGPVSKGKRRILLIDRAVLTRESLVQALQRQARDLVFCTCDSRTIPDDEAHDLFLVNVKSEDPDVPEIAALIEHLRDDHPGTPVMILSDVEDSGLAVRTLRNDLQGYVPTSLTTEMLLAAIRLVLAGGIFIPGQLVVDGLPDQSASPEVRDNAVSAPATETMLDAPVTFTEREAQVLTLLRRGEPNKIIAHVLDISPSTVKVHIHHIMSKLKVHNRTQVVHLINDCLPANGGGASSSIGGDSVQEIRRQGRQTTVV